MLKKLTLFALALGSFAAFMPSADAAFSIRITTSGGASETITDNGAGDSNLTDDGVIVFNGLVGSFTVSVQTASYDYLPGVPNNQTLLTNDVKSVTTTADGTITFETSANGFNAPSEIFAAGYSVSGTAPLEQYTFKGYFNDGNALFGTEEQIGNTFTNTALNTDPVTGQFGGLGSEFVNGEPTFSLTNVSSITLAAGEGASFSDRTSVIGTGGPVDIPGIPEPASMILFGMGGIGLLGGAVRRRRAEKAAA